MPRILNRHSFLKWRLTYFDKLLTSTVKVLLFIGTNFRGFIKYIDPWVLEFVVSNITDKNQWENCNSLDFNFRSLSEPRNQRKLEPHD